MPVQGPERVSPPGNAVLATLVAGIALALIVTVLIGPSTGGLLLGVDLVIGAILRLVLPTRVAGSLVVRSRGVDVGVLLVLAVACLTLAWALPFG
ncbi:MAG: DUF3017 domain-containing protein [Janthinobacterium lividum]